MRLPDRFLFYGLLISSMVLAGCVGFQVKRDESSHTMQPMQTVQLHSFVWGFVPAKKLSESELCPQARIERLKLGLRPRDVLLTVVTLGIYVPHHAEIQCSRRSPL